MPQGKILLSGEGDHRLCPAAIAVDTETGVEVEWPSHWPTRRKWDAETGLPTDWSEKAGGHVHDWRFYPDEWDPQNACNICHEAESAWDEGDWPSD